ncbi:MAG: M48 family metalloprotease [Treponemataceae bacterium]|nr:MAG: M48 family metalloprotease [Treponemataceae bacterium]
MKKFCVAFFILPVFFVFFSCESMDSDSFGNAVGSTAGAFLGEEKGVAFGAAAAAAARAGEGFAPEQEYYIGRAVAATLLQTYRIYNAPAFTEYLNEIVMTLAVNSPVPEIYNGYHTAILDTNEINAFATSGGHILVTRGLLAAAESEDALAAVLAHELAHIQLGHSTKAIRSSRVVDTMLANAATIAAANDINMDEVSRALGDSVNDVVSTLVTKGYSQTQEYDADKYALSLMASAGYDPRAMADMLAVLQRQSSSVRGGLTSTHPSATNRLSRVNTDLNTPAYQNLVINGRNERNARYAKTKL